MKSFITGYYCQIWHLEFYNAWPATKKIRKVNWSVWCRFLFLLYCRQVTVENFACSSPPPKLSAGNLLGRGVDLTREYWKAAPGTCITFTFEKGERICRRLSFTRLSEKVFRPYFRAGGNAHMKLPACGRGRKQRKPRKNTRVWSVNATLRHGCVRVMNSRWRIQRVLSIVSWFWRPAEVGVWLKVSLNTPAYSISSQTPFDMWNAEAPRGLKLYVQRVGYYGLRRNSAGYLRFVKGIVDSNDLSVMRFSRNTQPKDPNRQDAQCRN